MNHILRNIEKNHDITILFACEAGSRAWQSASNESDYDIRFIYKHNDLRDYLSLTPIKEVIDGSGSLDIHGWDIRKALQLARKSNPSIYEWSCSPIIYKDVNLFSSSLREIVQEYYSPFALCMHYGSLMNRNLKEIKSKTNFSMKRQKQLIQVVRAMLIVRDMVATGTVTCHERSDLMSYEVLNQDRLKDYYVSLVHKKIEGTLIHESLLEELIGFLETERDYYIKQSKQLATGKDMTEALNRWLWELLGI